MNFRGSRGCGFQRGRGSQHGRGARGRGQLHPTSPSMMPKSEVAQGKKELNPTRPSMTPKSESQWSKSPISAESSIHGPLSRLYTYALVPPTLAPGDWSPLDDDAIEVVHPNGSDKAPTRDELHAYILSTVKGPITKKRLPVFKAIYQEEEEEEEEEEEHDFLESHDWPCPSAELYLKKSMRGRDPK